MQNYERIIRNEVFVMIAKLKTNGVIIDNPITVAERISKMLIDNVKNKEG